MQPLESWFETTALEMDISRMNNAEVTGKPRTVKNVLKSVKQWLKRGKKERLPKPLNAIGDAPNPFPWVATVIYAENTSDRRGFWSPICHFARSGLGSAQVPIGLIIEGASMGRKLPNALIESEMWDLLLY